MSAKKESKVCLICQIEKPAKSFSNSAKCNTCRGKNNNRYKLKHPEQLLLRRAQERATRFSLDFNLTIEDIVIPPHCPLLGIELVLPAGKGRQHNSPSLDRKDNRLGYVKGNVQVISNRANTLKSDLTADELLLFAKNLPAYLN